MLAFERDEGNRGQCHALTRLLMERSWKKFRAFFCPGYSKYRCCDLQYSKLAQSVERRARQVSWPEEYDEAPMKPREKENGFLVLSYTPAHIAKRQILG